MEILPRLLLVAACSLVLLAPASPTFAVGSERVDLSAVKAVASATDEPKRAAAYARFLGELATDSDMPIDTRLHRAWAAYLLAANDEERGRLLAYAATIPDARARMLIGSFREFPALRKAWSDADRAHSALLLKDRPRVVAPGEKRPAPRDVYGPNPFDAPFTADRWSDPHGFVGRWAATGITLDLVAYPADNFIATLSGFDGHERRLLGFRSGSTLTLLGHDARGTLRDGRLTLQLSEERIDLRRTPVGKTYFAQRPAAARVLLDDTTGLIHFRHANAEAAWKILPDGSVEIDPAKGSLFTKDAWGDLRGYLEFRHAYNSESLGPRRGNSGLYLFNSYEIQLIDSFGLPPAETSEGSVYHLAVPRVTVSAPPLEWQSLEFDFRAPRFDAAGRKTASARLTLWLNGVKLHDDVEIPHPTGGSPAGGREQTDVPGPQGFMLQNHGGLLQFRNIWVLPAEI